MRLQFRSCPVCRHELPRQEAAGGGGMSIVVVQQVGPGAQRHQGEQDSIICVVQ